MWWSHQSLGSNCRPLSYFSLCVSAVGDPFPCGLTCDHDPVVHTGGQLWVLQACLLPGVGWAQPESARSSTLVWLLLRTQPTCRVCSPPPQLRLHAPHSPTDQLGRHKRNAAESTGSSSIAHYRFRAARWWRNRGRGPFVSPLFRVTSLVKWTLLSSIYWMCNQRSNSTNLAEISAICFQ